MQSSVGTGSNGAELQTSLGLSKHPTMTRPNSAHPGCVDLFPNPSFYFFLKNNAYVANYTLLTKAVITAWNYHGPYLEKNVRKC